MEEWVIRLSHIVPAAASRPSFHKPTVARPTEAIFIVSLKKQTTIKMWKYRITAACLNDQNYLATNTKKRKILL